MHCSPCDFLVTSLDVLPTSALMIVWLAVTEFIKSWEWDCPLFFYWLLNVVLEAVNVVVDIAMLHDALPQHLGEGLTVFFVLGLKLVQQGISWCIMPVIPTINIARAVHTYCCWIVFNVQMTDHNNVYFFLGRIY